MTKHLYMFGSQWSDQVRQGIKRQTIRPPRKRPIQAGDWIDARAWSARPYRSKMSALIVAPITRVETITITFTDVIINDQKLSDPDLSKLAQSDGFHGYDRIDDFLNYFSDTYSLPLTANLIQWQP